MSSFTTHKDHRTRGSQPQIIIETLTDILISTHRSSESLCINSRHPSRYKIEVIRHTDAAPISIQHRVESHGQQRGCTASIHPTPAPQRTPQRRSKSAKDHQIRHGQRPPETPLKKKKTPKVTQKPTLAFWPPPSLPSCSSQPTRLTPFWGFNQASQRTIFSRRTLPALALLTGTACIRLFVIAVLACCVSRPNLFILSSCSRQSKPKRSDSHQLKAFQHSDPSPLRQSLLCSSRRHRQFRLPQRTLRARRDLWPSFLRACRLPRYPAPQRRRRPRTAPTRKARREASLARDTRRDEVLS